MTNEQTVINVIAQIGSIQSNSLSYLKQLLIHGEDLEVVLAYIDSNIDGRLTDMTDMLQETLS